MAIQAGTPSRQLKDYFRLAVYGFCMGSAIIVPGVSSTIALVLGFYEELIDAINSVNLAFFRRLFTFRLREAFDEFPWRFLLALGLGIVLAIYTLAQGIDTALEYHPALVWAFFFGLVLASAVVLRKRVARWSPVALLIAGLAAVAAFVLIGLTPAQTPDETWFLLLSGAVVTYAGILPGLSGTLILVLLGKYQYMLEAVARLDVVTLLVFSAGGAGGLIIAARTLRWLFLHQRDNTISALIGLTIGSLRGIWPWKEQGLPTVFTLEVVLVLVMAAFGIGLVLILEYLAARRHR